MSKWCPKTPSSKCGKAATNASPATKAASSSHSRKSKKKSPTPIPEDKLASESEEESQVKHQKSTGPGCITWSNLSHTDRLLEWLDQNTKDRQKLFSDSSQDAHKEQRRQYVASGSKVVYHLQIATAVFSVDARLDIHEEFNINPDKYAKAIENCLGVLKTKYCEFNNEIGQTGAGLKVEEITEGSELSNKIAQLEQNFPFWLQLHRFWRTLPNFNPWTVSSEPGQDLVAEAMQHIASERKSETALDAPAFYNNERSDGGHNYTLEHDADAELESDGQGPKASQSTSTFTNSHSHEPSISTQSSHKRAKSTSRPPPTSKQGLLEAFKAKTDAHESRIVNLASKRQDYKMVLLAVKKQKIEITGTWEHKKERIAAEERQLAAKECMQEKDHQREHKKEVNTLAKIQLKIELAQAQAGNNFNSGGNFHSGRFDGLGDAVAGADVQYGLPDVNFRGLNGDYLS